MKRIVQAVATVTIFSLITRTLCFLFKFYLSNKLGPSQMGIYQAAIAIYFVVLTLVSSGIPIAVSALVAENHSKNRKYEENIISSALLIGFLLSFIVQVAVIILYNFKSEFINFGLVIIFVPSLFASTIISAYRGALWGHNKYFAVSMLETIEQLFRMLICILMLEFCFNAIQITALTYTITMFFSAMVCIFTYLNFKKTCLKLKNPFIMMKPLIKTSAPITFIRTGGSLLNAIIALLIPYFLTLSGYNEYDAYYIFGSTMGMAMPILTVPNTLVSSLAFVLIPTLTETNITDKNEMKKHIENAIVFAIVISCAFIPFFISAGYQTGVFLFKGDKIAGEFITYSAWIALPLAIEMIASSMMNSLKLEKQGFLIFLFSNLILFLIMFTLRKHFNMKIMSILFGLTYSFMCVLDLTIIIKKTHITCNFISKLLRSILLLFPATLLTKITYNIFEINEFFRLAITGCSGFFSFLILAIVFEIINPKALIKKKLDVTTPKINMYI